MFKDLLDNHVTEQVQIFKYPGNRMSISEEFDLENKINSFVTIDRIIRKMLRKAYQEIFTYNCTK
jgi:hypothetical protein